MVDGIPIEPVSFCGDAARRFRQIALQTSVEADHLLDLRADGRRYVLRERDAKDVSVKSRYASSAHLSAHATYSFTYQSGHQFSNYFALDALVAPTVL
jgi:hypothetical protein